MTLPLNPPQYHTAKKNMAGLKEMRLVELGRRWYDISDEEERLHWDGDSSSPHIRYLTPLLYSDHLVS